MNSNQFVERISFGGTNNPTIELTGGNRDMKINFTLETVELNKGVSARSAQSNLFGSIGKTVPGSEKNIRIKYNVNKKQLELEYTQSGQPSLNALQQRWVLWVLNLLPQLYPKLPIKELKH